MKKNTKIIIFIPLFLLIIAIAIFLLTNLVWVRNGDLLPNVVYKSTNIIVQELQQGNRNLIILGAGGSLSVDSNNRLVNHDPMMTLPDFKFQNATVMTTYYPFECEGLEKAGKELSIFLNSIMQDYDSITLIGHSKCGTCFANAAKWIEHENLTVITISAPFYGTIAADENAIREKLNWFENKIYQMIFSNHKVDQDIMPNSEFIRNADYSGLQNCTHINIISECPSKCINPIDILLLYFNKKAGINGDGLVSKESQSLAYANTITKELIATHNTSLKDGLELLNMITY